MVMADRQRPFIGVLIAQGPDAALERDGERLFLTDAVCRGSETVTLTSTWTRTERSALTQPDCESISHRRRRTPGADRARKDTRSRAFYECRLGGRGRLVVNRDGRGRRGAAGGGRPRLRLLLLAAGFGEQRHTHVVGGVQVAPRCVLDGARVHLQELARQVEELRDVLGHLVALHDLRCETGVFREVCAVGYH